MNMTAILKAALTGLLMAVVHQELFEKPRSVEEAVILYQNCIGELTPESIQSLFLRIGVLGVLGT